MTTPPPARRPLHHHQDTAPAPADVDPAPAGLRRVAAELVDPGAGTVAGRAGQPAATVSGRRRLADPRAR
ncbi:hypothetical protein ACWC5I_19860 [Kitasatospora sp. NPDC001574]